MNIDFITYNEKEATFEIKDGFQTTHMIMIGVTLFMIITLVPVISKMDMSHLRGGDYLLILNVICCGLYISYMFLGKTSWRRKYPLNKIVSLKEKPTKKGNRYFLRLSNNKLRPLGILKSETEIVELKLKFLDQGITED